MQRATLQQQNYPAAQVAWVRAALVHREDDMAIQGCWNPIHTSTLHDKIHFLREVREWINTTATNGHAYVKLGLRREWTAWANRRIKYFLRKLEEAA